MELDEYLKRNPPARNGPLCGLCLLKVKHPKLIEKLEQHVKKSPVPYKSLLGFLKQETGATVSIHAVARHLREEHGKRPTAK